MTGGIEGQELAQGPALVGRPQRGALDDRVGVLARQAAAVHRARIEHAAAGVEPEAALDVLAHPLAAHDEAVHERR